MEQQCEICEQMVDMEKLSGCEKCGRMFGPCCNSMSPDICVECAD